jgi:hypothetical protein
MSRMSLTIPIPSSFRHTEVFVATQNLWSHDDSSGALPYFELNYGIVPNVELHLQVPLEYDRTRPGGTFHFGYGDTELGVKWRFLDEDKLFAGCPELAISPLFEIPTGNHLSGLGNGQAQYFLPVFAGKSWGQENRQWELYGGGGYWINLGGGPDPKMKFTFGLWTVGNPAATRLAAGARAALAAADLRHARRSRRVRRQLPRQRPDPHRRHARQADQIKKDFKKALKDNNLVVPMATTNLFTDPVFKDGAFTSNNAKVRAYAIQKTMRAMDLGAEFGAKIYVFWGGREGVESDATKDPVEAIKRFREAINFLCEYSIEQKYGYKFAFEAKPNEPRGHIYFAVTGSYLAFIPTLATRRCAA